jgi:hypothetical protein
LQYVKVDKSTLDKRRLKQEMELAVTIAGGNKFQQDMQRLKKSFSLILVEHKRRNSLLPLLPPVMAIYLPGGVLERVQQGRLGVAQTCGVERWG